MAKEEVEKWVFTTAQVSVKETVEKWGISLIDAEKLLESIESSSGDVFELLFAVSGLSPAPSYSVVASSQLAQVVSSLTSVQVMLFGLRVKHTSHQSVLRQSFTALLGRVEECEGNGTLYVDRTAGVGGMMQFRRSVYVHKRGPSPDGTEGSRRGSFRPSFPKPAPITKRKAESPLKGVMKKPKVGKKAEPACKTLHSYFK